MNHVPAGVNEYLANGGLEIVCFDFDSQPFESVRSLFIWANDANAATQKLYDGLPPHGTQEGLDKKQWAPQSGQNQWVTTENGTKRRRQPNEKAYLGVNNKVRGIPPINSYNLRDSAENELFLAEKPYTDAQFKDNDNNVWYHMYKKGTSDDTIKMFASMRKLCGGSFDDGDFWRFLVTFYYAQYQNPRVIILRKTETKEAVGFLTMNTVGDVDEMAEWADDLPEGAIRQIYGHFPNFIANLDKKGATRSAYYIDSVCVSKQARGAGKILMTLAATIAVCESKANLISESITKSGQALLKSAFGEPFEKLGGYKDLFSGKTQDVLKILTGKIATWKKPDR